MSKHTAGPWNRPGDGTRLEDKEKRFICHLDGMDLKHNAGCRANAKLIAAAPDLLAAVENLVLIFQTGNHYDTRNPYTRPEVIGAMKTIAKATGFTGDWTSANDKALHTHNDKGDATP